MGFAGNLRTLALPEVLQTLNRIKATGVLRLASAEGGRDVVFADGALIGIAFRRGEERQALLKRLILDGRLDATTAAQISSSGRESQVVARLIEGGSIDQATVNEAVQRQAEEELQSLFTWDYADFVFHDAGPEAEEINQSVERARADGLAFNINSLLMESARRQDEWEKVRQVFPDGGLVLGPREGLEAQLQEAAREYPASAVLPLVDAVRALDDIVRDSVVTRLDAWTCLAALMERGLVVPLTRDDIIYHGDYLASKNDNLRASSLYRRALSARPSDTETARKLADCLAKLGDSPEAAASFAQLALGALNAQDPDQAVTHARKAVGLAPKDPVVRQTMVRCLLAQDPRRNAGEAVGELLQLVELYGLADRLEDARSTCLQVLELDKANEPARRQLARIFSAAARDEQSEDVVVCVQCGHINHREAAECEKCKASLQLTCLACGRPVGVSDRLCIFCGADPHRGSQSRRSGGSPATSRIVNPDKIKAGVISGGPQAVADKLDALVAVARAKEEAQDWEGALTAWREVSSIQVDNPDLITHIRSLETLVHDTFVEQQIEKGHQLRRVRRYWSAIRCYKAALRTMPSDDPRTQRLVEILASTTRVGQRIALLYAAAFLIIILGAAMALQPWLKQRRVDSEIAMLAAQVDDLAANPSGVQLVSLKPEIDALNRRIEELGDGRRWQGARTRVLELGGAWAVAWQRAGSREIEQIAGLVDQGDLKRARERMAAFHTLYQERSPRVVAIDLRLDEAQKQRDALNTRIQDAPRLFAGAEAEEAGGRLGVALGLYRSLAESPNAEVVAKAKAAVARLAPRADAATATVQNALDLAQTTMTTDLPRADGVLAAIEAEAGTWALGERVRTVRGQIAQAMAAGRAAAAQLGADASVEAMAAFLQRHPGVPEAGPIRQRHVALLRAQAARTQAVERYRSLMAEQRYEQAWSAGRDLVAGYGPGDIRLPLWVEAQLAGSVVKLDGRVLGPAPLLVTYAPGQRGELVIEASGFQPIVGRLETLSAAWNWSPRPTRAVLWRTQIGKSVGGLAALTSQDLAVLAGDGIAVIGPRGQIRWRVAVGGDDLGSGRGRSEAPVALPGGGLAAGLAGSGTIILDERGAAQRLQTTAEVRGRPLSYVNEVLGVAARVAFAGEALYSGEPGKAFGRIPLPAPAISGPVAIGKDIDRILIIADTRGRLVAIEESARRVIWEQDVQAADIGQLIPISDGEVVSVLDGSRLACFSVSPTGAALRWTHQLETQAVGDPVVSGGIITIASGVQLVRIGAEGTVHQALALPAPASTAVAAFADRLAVGTADGSLHLFRAGTLAWSTPLGAVPTAVVMGADSVCVADVNGQISSYVP
ncbi:MAG TPA: hypothetical protein DCS97_10545 [Planctomycetes bacterium]|nr:hypothetical protein [Planctomycetota bacterium]